MKISILTLLCVILMAITGCIDKPLDPEEAESVEVVWSNPLDGTTGETARSAYNESYDIAVQFSKTMDMTATNAATSVYCGEDKIENVEMHWLGGNILALAFPGYTYQIGREYLVCIDTNAISVDGESMEKPDTIRFMPEPELRIISVYAGQTWLSYNVHEIPDTLPVDIGIEYGLIIGFNALIDTSRLFEDSTCIASNLPYEVTVSSMYNSYGTGTALRLTFNESDLVNTDPWFRLTRKVVTPDNHALSGENMFRFNAYPFKLSAVLVTTDYTYGLNFQTNGIFKFADTVRINHLSPSTALYFSRILPAITDSIQSRLIITPAMDYEVSLSNSDQILIKTAAFRPSTDYTISILPSFCDTYGYPLGDTASVVFRTECFAYTGGNILGIAVPEDPRRPQNMQIMSVYGFSFGYGAGMEDVISNSTYLKAGLSHTPVTLTYDRWDGMLEFNTALDSATLSSSISLSPPDNGFGYQFSNSNILFRSVGYLTPLTGYTLTIGAGLKDIYGDSLGCDVTFACTTETFGLIGLDNYYDTIALGDTLFSIDEHRKTTDEQIENFMFNYVIDPLSVRNAISTVPALPGQITVDGNTIRLYNDTTLIPDTTYTITLGNGITEKHGFALGKPITYSFVTEPLKVPEFNDYNVLSEGLMQFTFNSPIHRDSVLAHVSVSPVGKYNALVLADTSMVARTFKFDTDSIPRLGEILVFSIDSTLTDIYGKSLKAGYDTTFVVLTERQ
jgi:hypothetical protein